MRMTGRHAAAEDADDEARAATQPDPHGAHRADDAGQREAAEPAPLKRLRRRRAARQET